MSELNNQNNTRDFTSFGLPDSLMLSLHQMGFTTPTPIQEKAIPLALLGKDVLGSAQTGTGKTAAFAIPLVNHLLASPRGGALVLTPTRELAVQVLDTIHQLLGKRSPLRTALLIGGESMGKQFGQLRYTPRIIVGTPGRINDHLNRGSLRLNETNFLVLDETDRMLDIGFGVQLERIATYLPEKRQTMMFSATMPANIMKLAAKYLTQPERISVGSTTTPLAKIKQEIIYTSEAEKYTHLLTQLEQRQGSILVFVKTKRGAERLMEKISRQDHRADTIHGDLKQSKRDRVIQAFRDERYRILVATDVAARGLDIPHLAHVINYDLPQCPEDYIHRIGRTARAGAEGSAINLISPDDGRKWHAIHRLINPNEPFTGNRSGAPSGRKPSPSRRSGSFSGRRDSSSNGRDEGFSRGPSFGRRGEGAPKREDSRGHSFGRRGETSSRGPASANRDESRGTPGGQPAYGRPASGKPVGARPNSRPLPRAHKSGGETRHVNRGR